MKKHSLECKDGHRILTITKGKNELQWTILVEISKRKNNSVRKHERI